MPSIGLAQSMNAEEFHQRATRLQAKGPLALFSGGEIRALTKEGKAAGESARLSFEADAAAGRPPRFCPPKGRLGMTSNEYVARLSAIPAAQRSRIDLTEATIRIFAAKYPCAA